MSFKVNSIQKQDIGISRVEGEVDMFTSPGLRDKLTPFFEKKINAIVVDLSGVSFMDSSGIATLVEGLQWSKRVNKAFVLTGLGANVMNALSLTKLETVFTIEEDTDAVVEQLCKP